MKKIVISFAIACMALISSAKTLDEVRAEYTDGTYVYSTRYDGTGSNRMRYDTVKLPSGKVTILIVNEPESGYEKKRTKVVSDNDDWKNGTMVFATTNKHGSIKRVYKKSDDKLIIKTSQVKDEQKNQASKSKKSVKAPLLKASSTTNIVKKSVWQYDHSNIKKYVENDPTQTNLLVSASVKKPALLKAGTNTTSKIRSRLLRSRYFEGDYDGGYYIMDDDTVISYRDALNQGWADLPTNSIQQAVFDDVTSDPDSLWTKRVIFHDNPNQKSEKRTHKARSNSFRVR